MNPDRRLFFAVIVGAVAARALSKESQCDLLIEIDELWEQTKRATDGPKPLRLAWFCETSSGCTPVSASTDRII
jgi:hypothetical protein